MNNRRRVIGTSGSVGALLCSLLVVSTNGACAHGGDGDRQVHHMRFHSGGLVANTPQIPLASSILLPDQQSSSPRAQRMLNHQSTLSRHEQRALSMSSRQLSHLLNRSTFVSDAGQTRSLRAGLSLDLASSAANITVGSKLLDGQTITIDVDRGVKELSAGSKVTAAEYAALSQKLITGSQGLVLNADGVAIDGSLNINTVSDSGKTIRASSVVIPEHVTVIGDFARTADGVRVNGDIINNGSLYAVSSNTAHHTAVIAARDINNEQSGLISTSVPESIASQLGAIAPELNLALRASRDLNNAGIISSSGDLELSAGHSLNNMVAGETSLASGAALAQAHGNLLLNASNINNHGLLSSSTGNVVISGANDSNIVVNNAGGEIRALSGNIDVTTNSVANPKLNTTLNDGAWNAHQLNISSSDGEASGHVEEISATVNIKAGTAHFWSNSDLALGIVTLTGDPVFESGGNFTIAGDINTSGNPLAIIASGNITAGPAATSIDAGGGSILIVSGAQHAPNGSNIQITGGTALGGNIDLTGITSITSSSKVDIIAFGGTVKMDNSSGISGGLSGNVQVIAEKTTGTSIDIGSISGNSVMVFGAPIQVNGPFLVDNTNPATTGGGIVSGSFSPDSNLTSASIKVNSLFGTGPGLFDGTVQVRSGGNVSAFVLQAGSGILATTGGDLSVTAINGNSGSVSIFTPSLTLADLGAGISGGFMDIEGVSGQGLTINGGATSTSISSSNGLTSIHALGDLNFFGKVNFGSDFALFADAGTQKITVNNGAAVTGPSGLTLHANDLILQGTGTISASPLTFVSNSGRSTIANSTGPIDLNGLNLHYSGTSLAILSAGDIVNTGSTITLDLSEPSNVGNSLLLIAGYKFTPTTTGTASGLNSTTYTLDAEPNSGSGSINLGNVNINLSANAGGGNLSAFAHGGSIALGTIDTTSVQGGSFHGGSVNLQAFTNINVGAINTTSLDPDSAGSVTLRTGTFTQTFTAVKIQGAIVQGGFSQVTNSGNITVNSINASRSSIFLFTDGAGNSINVNGALTAKFLSFSAGLATVHLNTTNTLTAQRSGTGDGGTVSFNAASFTTSGGPLTLNASGSAAGSGGIITYTDNSTTAVTIGGAGGITFDASGGINGGSVTVTAKGDLTVNSGAINAAGANGVGAKLFLKAGQNGIGTLTLNDGTFFNQANATGSNSNGGQINLNAPFMSYSNSAQAPFELSANGKGTGDGGRVAVFVTSDVTPVFLGSPLSAVKGAANFLTLSATSGLLGGDGGHIQVEVAGNLTIDPAAANASRQAAGNFGGAVYLFTAGTAASKGATILVNGSIDASSSGSGTGGFILIETTNKKALVLHNAKTTNGVTGTLTASGSADEIDVYNHGGGVTVTDAAALSSKGLWLLAGDGGSIAAKGVVLNASNYILLTSGTGSIGGSGTKELQVSTAELTIASQGTVGIHDVLAGSVEINNSTAGGSFTVHTAGGTILDGITTTKGAISIINDTGTLTVQSGATLNAANGALTLQNNDISNGSVLIGDNSTVKTSGKGGAVTISIGPAPKKGIDSATPANVNVTESGKGQVFFGPAGGVVGPALLANAASVNAINVNVIFNNGSANIGTKKITLGDFAVVTADPPGPHSSKAHVTLVDSSL